MNKNKVRTVVVRKDFTTKNTVVSDFLSVKNTIIDSSSNRSSTELKDIIDTIRKQKLVNPKELEEHFWNMFVIDAFIGNWDRHNGNWGFLYNVETDQMKIAPIFDCGSSLYPQIDDVLRRVIESKPEMNFVFKIFQHRQFLLMVNVVIILKLLALWNMKDAMKQLKKLCLELILMR